VFSVTASAPGKVILLGEHAAVYGKPALVAAAGLRLSATVTTAPDSPSSSPTDSRVRLRIIDGEHDETTTWQEILAASRSARFAWERYAAAPSADAFREVASATAAAGSPAGALLRIALGEAADSLAAAGVTVRAADLAPIDLTVTSEIPIGSGFGSSAAAAVAVIFAYLAARGARPAPEDLQRLSLEVERRQHGTPSGVDNATVIHGGVIEARRTAGGAVAIQQVPIRPETLQRFRIAASGAPAEGTGTVVAAVSERRARDPETVDGVFDRLADLTASLRDELCRSHARPEAVVDVLRQAHCCLVDLDVVPAPVRDLVRQVEEIGGAAKISGAGSLAGPGAGNVLLYHPDPPALDRFLAAYRTPETGGSLVIYDVALGAPGACLDAPSAPPRGALRGERRGVDG